MVSAPPRPAPAGPAGAARRPPDQWLATRPVPLLAALAAALVALVVTGRVVSGGPGETLALTAVLAACHLPLGIFVLRRMPGHPLGRLMLLTGVLAAVATIVLAWPGPLPLAWLGQWTWWPPLAVLPVLLLVAPDGTLPSRRWRPLLVLLVGAGTTAAVAFAIASAAAPRTLLSGGSDETPAGARAGLGVAVGAVGMVLLGCLAVLVAFVVRWRAAGPLARRQLACLLPAAAALAAGLVVDAFVGSAVAWSVAVAALPVGLAVAVLRYRLHDLDLYVHRGAVWLLLSGLVVVAYALTVTLLGLGGAAGGLSLPAVLAAGLVAAALQPGQRLAQRAVNRLLYGRRDDPHALLTGLARRLGSVPDPLEVLPAVARTIVDELRVPYVAVRVRDESGDLDTAAEHGRWSGEPERFALRARGHDVGELLVAARRPGEGFGAADTTLLRDLAGQTAQAVDAVRSSVALARARDRLVLAREEERRRLRRDLHDGVASSLTGSRMLAAALRTDPSSSLVDTLAADLDAAVAEVRALIDGLRPADLDDGLAAALRALADRGAGPPVTLTVRGDLDDLPAAVEVAAYRIVTEALTNVAKHARAGRATVTVERGPRDLRVRVDDDGVGIGVGVGPDPASGPGVGIGSITGRAAELGGRATVGATAVGTRVSVVLPLPG